MNRKQLHAAAAAQREALLKRAIRNELGDDPGPLAGRLSMTEQDGVQRWHVDGKHVATTYPPALLSGGRVVLPGEIHNEPEPEAVPGVTEYIIERGRKQ